MQLLGSAQYEKWNFPVLVPGAHSRIRASGRRNAYGCCGTIVHFFLRAAGIGLLVSKLIAFLIPRTYVSTSRLMPPDTRSSLASVRAVAARQ